MTTGEAGGRYGRPVESPDVDAVLARELRAIAREGLTYSDDVFDRKRYEAVGRIAAQAAARVSGRAPATVWPSFLDDAGHPTPKVDVRGAVFRDSALLLVRERSDGGWTLPGGWADPGHSPSENVVREVREESGLAVRATRLVALLDRERHPHPARLESIYKLFFICEEADEPATTPDHEIDEVGFFELDVLPPLSATRVTETQLRLVAAHNADPTLPTVFD